MERLIQQFAAFFGVGIVAAVIHYSTLIGLVELGGSAPVPATLAGYLLGGIVSYILNRRHTYESDRSHGEAGWRFVLVAAVGFCCTWALMFLFVDRLAWPYLPAQVLTTGIVVGWSFFAHKIFTFADRSGRPEIR